MLSEVAHRLARRADQLKPTVLLPTGEDRPAEHYGKRPVDVGSTDSHLLAFGRHLSYYRSEYTAAREECILGMRVEGDPYKLCFNLSDRVVTNYVQGLGAAAWYPGTIHLHPFTSATVLVSPGTRARFAFLVVARDFMGEIAAEAGLPKGVRPPSEPSEHEPWLMSGNAAGGVLGILASIEGSPLQGGLRRLYAEAKALELIALLLAQMCLGSSEDPGPSTLRARDVRKVHEARDILHGSIDDLPSLAQIARAVGMSATGLKRAYRAVLGVPVYQDARNERLRRARVLLAQGDLSVSEVADRVGYRSQSYFTVAFKKQFGVLPREVWPRTVKKMSSKDNPGW